MIIIRYCAYTRPLYNIETIPTDDVRDKPEVKAKEGKDGLIDRGGKKIKDEYVDFLKKMFNNIDNYHK